MVKALLEAGADRSIENDEGLTAEEMAQKAGDKHVAEMLVRNNGARLRDKPTTSRFR